MRPTVRKDSISRQIARELTDQILTGALPPGSELPAEGSLALHYSVHRLTVRQAMADLQHQGLVVTGRGRRSVVAEPPVRYPMDQSPGASIVSGLASQGLTVRHQVRAIGRAVGSTAPLDLGAASCTRYDYDRWVDDLPWSRSTTWLVDDLAPDNWLGTEPLMDAVARKHDLEIHRGCRIFAAVPASLDEAESLGVLVGAPLLRVTGTNVDDNGRTVAVVSHLTRGDRAEYIVNLT